MSFYKNREVTVINNITDTPNSYTNVTIRHKDGMLESVPLSEVYFTSEEKSNIDKNAGKRFDTLKVISDKDAKEIKDSQDPKKIEENRKPATKDVTIKATKANISSETV